MGLKTKIEYVSATHNFWLGGCNKISEGCRNCFAEKMFKRFYGKDFSKPILSKNFDAPLKWKKPQVILVNDMSDFFHSEIDTKWIDNALEIMVEAKQHTFLLLTKRPHNIYKKLYEVTPDNPVRELGGGDYIPNVWLGVSVENQKAADERIPELIKIPHFKKWISFEPLLGNIEISQKLLRQISWAIVGGETGIKIGISPIIFMQWAIFLKEQCKYANVPFFFKQMPAKGFIPQDIMVREYPPEIARIKNL